MDINKLKEFACLAETLNYRVAANLCYISQPTLSKHIAALESELSCKLLIRTKATVELTDCGEIVLKHTKELLDIYDDLLFSLNTAKSNNAKPLSIGYLFDAGHKLLTRFYQCTKDEEGNLSFDARFKLLPLEKLKPALDDNVVDIVIDTDDCYENSSLYNMLPLYRDSCVVIVPKSHPFAKQKSITIEDLRGETLIAPESASDGFNTPLFQDIFYPELLEHINLTCRNSDPSELPWYLNNNEGIVFTGSFLVDTVCNSNLTWIPVEGSNLSYNLCVVWKAQNETPELLNCIRSFKKLLKTSELDDCIPVNAKKLH